MKKKFYISFVALAVLTVLAPTVIPHHHHDGVACMITGHCDKEDDSMDDEHAENDMNHGASCVSDADYIVPQSDNETKCKVASCHNHNHIHFFPVPFFLAHPSETASLIDYGGYLSFYISVEANRFHGLRAPPFIG